MEVAAALERHSQSELRRERNSYRRSRTEEISQCSFGDLKLVQAGDGRGCAATWVRANTSDIGNAGHWIGHHLRRWNRKLHHIDCVVRPGIVTVEEIEELDERVELPALVEFERTRDPQV